MEQNREVMAVPGNITSRNSVGTNYLIKSGAKLVQQWQDIVAELPSEIAAEILPPKIEKANGRYEAAKQELAPADLSSNERTIWTLLSPDEPAHIDGLLEESGLSFGDLNGASVGLDLKDLIRVLPGKHYARTMSFSETWCCPVDSIRFRRKWHTGEQGVRSQNVSTQFGVV